MSKAKLKAAQELLKAKRYGEARAILESIPQDPTAQKWLAKLDEIAPLTISRAKPKHVSRPVIIVAGLLALVIVVGVAAVILSNRSQPDQVATLPTAAPVQIQTVNPSSVETSAEVPPLNQIYSVDDFLSFDYPEGWAAAIGSGGSSIILYSSEQLKDEYADMGLPNGSAIVYLETPTYAFFGAQSDATVLELTEKRAEQLRSGGKQIVNIVALTLGGRDVGRFETLTTDRETITFVLKWNAGVAMLIELNTRVGYIDEFEPILEAIVSSLRSL